MNRISTIESQKNVNRNGHSLFAWIQLFATLSVPIAIAIYTVVQNSNAVDSTKQNRLKDLEIATANRAKDEKIADDERKENILVEYQNFIAKLLLDHGMTLNESESARFVVRVKTLTAVKQLDPARKAFLIQSLFEANLITTTLAAEPVVSLESADLSNLYIGIKEDNTERPSHACLSFDRAILTNSTFRYDNLNGASFAYAYLRFADFTNSMTLSTTKCYRQCTTKCINFTAAILNEASLQRAFYTSAVFTDAQMFKANLQGFDCHQCEIGTANMSQADLSRATFAGRANLAFSKFIDSKLINATFKEGIDIRQADFTRVNAAGITIRSCSFFSATLVNGSFNRAIIEHSEFTGAWMNGVSIIQGMILNCFFHSAKLTNANLSDITCHYCMFINTILTGSNLQGASFTMCNFTGAIISDEQLAQTSSLAGSTLPNGTVVSN
jgi:uncharacterized protein YjbI with pentapeptide repeats